MRFKPIALLLALSGVSPSVIATDAEIDLTRFSLEEILDMDVYAASKFPQKSYEAPSAVTVITAEEIKTYGYRTLADILQSLPGVYVSYDRNHRNVGVRGFGRPNDDNNHLLFLVDGHRLNDNLYDAGRTGTDFILDVDLIKRVEFLPAGPATALYGNNAFFGVISITTKSGRNLDGVEVTGSFGTDGTHKTRASLGQKFSNGLDLLLSASAYHSDGRDLYFPEFDAPTTHNGIASDLDYDGFQQFFSKLTFEGWALEWGRTQRTKGLPTSPFLYNDFNDPRWRDRNQQSFASLSYRDTWSPTLDVQGRVFYGAYDTTAHYIFSDLGEIIDQGAGRWWGLDLQAVSTTFDRHKLAFGVEYQHDLRRDQDSTNATDALDIHTHVQGGERWGLYALDEFALTDRTKLNVGLRYDQATHGDRHLKPRLGLVHQWDDATTLKLLYGEAFRAPNAHELYYEGYQLNPDLQAETIQSYELALEKRLDQRTRFNLSLYRYHIQDLIDLTLDADSGLYRYRNLSEAKGTGLALEATRSWADGQQLRASYSWQLAEDGEGSWLDNSPRHLAKLNWSLPLFDAHWRAGLELNYISPRRSTQGNTVDGVLLTHVNLSGQPFGKNFEIGLGVYNLFDQDYADPAGNEFLQTQIPQDGRQWRLKLDYRF